MTSNQGIQKGHNQSQYETYDSIYYETNASTGKNSMANHVSTNNNSNNKL